MTTGRLKQPIWIAPLAMAALVAVFGVWGNLRLRGTLERQLKAQLNATVDANVTALQIWMTNQMNLATSLADEPGLNRKMVEMLEQFDVTANARMRQEERPTNEEQLAELLLPRLHAIRFVSAQLVNTNLAIVAFSPPRLNFQNARTVSETHTNKYDELFTSGAPVIITPYKPELGRRGGPGRAGGRRGQRGGPNARGGGETNLFAPERGPERQPLNGMPTREDRGGARGPGPNGPGPGGPPPPRRGGIMQVATPVRDANDVVEGALALIIQPDQEFTRILSVAAAGETGETYAFDQTGLLLSRSRFDDDLRKMGILNATNANSALNLTLHDPAATPKDGAKPLIHIVASAVQDEDGVDVNPTRDYRGVMVVGAWRWLPEQGFGVATQMDASEAYGPLRILRWIFVILFLLLVLCSTGMFVFSYSNITWRTRLNEAELKLKQLGQYALEEKIGEGGMGAVYRARHALLRRDTAVKLLLPDRADSVSIRRFEREVRLTCQLTHPNTIQVYDYGHTPEGVFYYAMEYLTGLNLHDLVGQFGPQAESRVAFILAQICDSLTEAHNLGLVHRDIKPGNVFLCSRGGIPDCVKVLDFGLVREYRDKLGSGTETTIARGVEGTPSFMPPESIKNPEKSDPRSDIYSLGALAYYLLTGHFVFNSESVLELYEKHLTETPTPPSKRTKIPVSPELDALILRCLEKDPDKRPQTAVELHALIFKTPHAQEWTVEARSAWWAQYHTQTQRLSSGAPKSPDEKTVKIDFASRV